jgi:hypothetical protein
LGGKSLTMIKEKASNKNGQPGAPEAVLKPSRLEGHVTVEIVSSPCFTIVAAK